MTGHDVKLFKRQEDALEIDNVKNLGYIFVYFWNRRQWDSMNICLSLLPLKQIKNFTWKPWPFLLSKKFWLQVVEYTTKLISSSKRL